MAAPRLFGRDRELAQWRGIASFVAGGKTAELTIAGPAGIGKTSLLDAVCEDAAGRGWHILRSSGDANRNLPGAMLWQWFAALAQQHPEGTAPFDGQGALVHRFLMAPGTQIHQDALSYSASWILRSLAHGRPVIAAVDDAQWLDEISLGTLRNIDSLLLDIPLLFARTVRTTERSGPGGEPAAGKGYYWNLEPLAPEAIEDWIIERQASSVPTNAARIQAASGGVPFYIHELLERHYPLPAHGHVAGTEDAVLRQRLSGRPEAEQVVLRAVVVLGEDATVPVVAAVTGLEEAAVATALERLFFAGFLAAARPQPKIRHALVAEALMAEVPAAELSRLHQRAADALRGAGADTAVVAAHLLATEPGNDPQTAEVLLAAAAEARLKGALQIAVQLGERALAEDGDGTLLQQRMLIETALAHQEAGKAETAAELFRRGLGLADDVVVRVEQLLVFADALYRSQRLEQAAECLAQALQELEESGEDHTDLHRRVIALAQGAGFQLLQLEEKWAAELAGILAQPPSADGPGDRLLLAQEALRLSLVGADAKRSGELAVRSYAGGKLLVENGPESNIINIATGALNGAERDAEALELLDAAIARARADSSLMAHATLAYCRGAIHFNRGRLRLAQVDLEASVRANDMGWQTYLEAAVHILANVYIARDDLAAADGLLRRVPLDPPRPPTVQAMALQVHGVVAAAHGNHESALEYFSAAMDLAEGLGPLFNMWIRGAIESAARSGHKEFGAALSRDALEKARAFGAPRTTAFTLRVAALTQQPQAAVVMLREAIDLLAAHEGRYEHALALADLAEICLAPDNAGQLGFHRQEGLAAARKALVLAHRIGAAAVARRMTLLLAPVDANLPLIAENKADRLSAAEHRVCSLAAKGMTNRQIAAELFITIKAVEWHLSRSFGKLEITSRKHLPAIMNVTEQPAD